MFEQFFNWLTAKFFPFLITREWLFVFSIILLIIIFLLIRKIRRMQDRLFEDSKLNSHNINEAINGSSEKLIETLGKISITLQKSVKTTEENEQQTKSENRGKKGESRVKEVFKKLFEGGVLNDIIVYHNLCFIGDNKCIKLQCDHIILTSQTIIVLETKNWDYDTYVTNSSDFLKLVPEKYKNLLYAPTENSNEPPIFLFNVRENTQNESIEIRPFTPKYGLEGTNVLKHLRNKTRALYKELEDELKEKANGVNTRSILLFVETGRSNLYFQPNRESNSLQSLQGYIVISKLADLEKAIAYSDRNQSQTKIDESTRKEIIEFMERNAKYVQDAHNPECREIGK